MRATTICLLLVCLSLTAGCSDQKQKPVVHEHLTPTAREMEVLEVHSLDPNSERGQDKIRKIRERRQKLREARERFNEMAERKAEEE